MPITKQSIVSFGKFKGQKYEVMLRDADYCKYLIRGTWLNGDSRVLLESFYPCENNECSGGKVYLADDCFRPCQDCRESEFKEWNK